MAASNSFSSSPLPVHSDAYRTRRFWNWFPMGLTYAFLYMGRYNLTVSKNALGSLMSKEDFGNIFGVGAIVYGCAFLLNGPLTDKMGGKKALLIAALGAGGANLAMGLYLQYVLGLPNPGEAPLISMFTLMYAANMYFQSFGAVAIVKVNAHWFHVRERGSFSGIFGVMISSGIFFAFDVSQRVLGVAGDAKWWVFLAPAILLGAMFLIELVLLKDSPGEAGQTDFDTGDASSGEEGVVPIATIMKRILTNPILLTLAFVEFCTGVLRNGVMHWFPIYAKEQAGALSQLGQSGGAWKLTLDNWGLFLWIAGVVGANVAGWVSDRFFGSRRAPAAGGLYAMLTLATLVMPLALTRAWPLCALALLMSICVIGTHGLLSGTATMDFGGRKGAATAVGLLDGFVYLGTGLQSFALGKITSVDWAIWPWFMLPFAIVGTALCVRIWNARPQRATPAPVAASKVETPPLAKAS